MSALPFIAVNARDILARHGLDTFQALWELKLDAIDEPNVNRGGWSSVYRLELEDADGQLQSFYLKRQDNHLTRSLQAPWGEPTFAREFRYIQAYARHGVPALEAAFYAERREPGHRQAILLTRALDGYQDADDWYQRWPTLGWEARHDLVVAAGALVRALHNAGMVHNCLYFKHVFLKVDGDGAGARLIDLEKTRRAWRGRRDFVADLETLLRRSAPLPRTQRLRFMLAYTGKTRVDAEVRQLIADIARKHQRKEQRR